LKVLIACEFSGRVRDAFLQRGHDALSCDLLPSESPGPHYEGDIKDILFSEKWDLMIAHPPCTYLTNSGVRWLYNTDGSRNLKRWRMMEEGVEFFNELLNAHIPKIAIENPVQHKYARELIKEKYSQIIQPWMFGHGETKKTCLWLKNLPLLQHTNIVEGREARIHKLPPSEDRWKERSRTYTGIAEAMVSQWGNYKSYPYQASLSNWNLFKI
jgi:hypothetical protein